MTDPTPDPAAPPAATPLPPTDTLAAVAASVAATPPPLACPKWTVCLKRGGLAVMAGWGIWMLWNGQYDAAVPTLAFVFTQLGIGEEQQAGLILTLRALVNSFHASQAAAAAAENTELLKGAVRDIQDNPGPGTPGWMDRHDATAGP